MDKPLLHSLVFFVDDIEAAASDLADLLGATLTRNDQFIVLRAGDLAVGFHPADDKSKAGSAAPYFKTTDLAQSIAQAESKGFSLYRGPITVDSELIVQLRNERDVRIGYVQKL